MELCSLYLGENGPLFALVVFDGGCAPDIKPSYNYVCEIKARSQLCASVHLQRPYCVSLATAVSSTLLLLLAYSKAFLGLYIQVRQTHRKLLKFPLLSSWQSQKKGIAGCTCRPATTIHARLAPHTVRDRHKQHPPVFLEVKAELSTPFLTFGIDKMENGSRHICGLFVVNMGGKGSKRDTREKTIMLLFTMRTSLSSAPSLSRMRESSRILGN